RLVLSRLTLFFFNDPATTPIYTLSLHDALPIYRDGRAARASARAHARGAAPVAVRSAALRPEAFGRRVRALPLGEPVCRKVLPEDRKSTRLNSSHVKISYAVFCLKKKKKKKLIK